MTSQITTRYTNAARHATQQLNASAAIFDANAELAPCDASAGSMRAAAVELRRLAAIIHGDIRDTE